MPHKTAKHYTESDLNFIKENYNSLSVKDIAKKLERTPKAVRSQIERLGLVLNKLDRNKAHEWTEHEINFIKDNYLALSDLKIGEVLNLSEAIVCRKRIEMDLRIHHCNEYVEGGYYKRYINGKKVWMHRFNAEKKIGRKLKTSEPVHHIDGNKLNNNPNNLYVCSDLSHHGLVHGSLERVAFKLVEKGIIKFNHELGEYYLQEPIRTEDYENHSKGQRIDGEKI